MKKKTIFILLASLFIFSAMATIAIAANPPSAIDQILGSIAGENFGKIYEKYGVFIDMVIYLIIFIGLTRWALSKNVKFQEGGKALQVGIGIVFAVGLALWGEQQGFNIMSFGPVAFGILVAIMCFAAYVGMKEFGIHRGTAAAIAYAAAFLVISASGAFLWLSTKAGIVVALLSILFILAIVWIGWEIIHKIMNFRKGRKGKVDTETGTGTSQPTSTKDEKKGKKDIDREEKQEENEAIQIKKMAEGIKALTDDLKSRSGDKTPAQMNQGARSVIRDITNKQLKTLRRINKRVEKFGVRLLNDLKTAGKDLKAEDEQAINLALKNEEGIKNLQMFGGDLIKTLKKDDNAIDPKVLDELDKFYIILNEMYKNTENLLLIDKRLREQIGA